MSAKPVMKRLLQTQITRNITIGLGLAVVAGVLTKIYVVDTRKAAYANFYAHYDAQKDFERKRAAGVFTSTE